MRYPEGIRPGHPLESRSTGKEAAGIRSSCPGNRISARIPVTLRGPEPWITRGQQGLPGNHGSCPGHLGCHHSHGGGAPGPAGPKGGSDPQWGGACVTRANRNHKPWKWIPSGNESPRVSAFPGKQSWEQGSTEGPPTPLPNAAGSKIPRARQPAGLCHCHQWTSRPALIPLGSGAGGGNPAGCSSRKEPGRLEHTKEVESRSTKSLFTLCLGAATRGTSHQSTLGSLHPASRAGASRALWAGRHREHPAPITSRGCAAVGGPAGHRG